MHPQPEPPAPTIELPRLLRWLGLGIVVLVAFSFAFVPLRSSQDEWWHLKAGKWIVEQGRLPTNDIFTYTGENLRWYNHEWLSQILFYGAYAFGEQGPLGGIRALILFKAIVVAGTFGLIVLLCRLRGAAWAYSILVALLAAEISRRTIYPRPPIFSYLLLTTFLVFLYGWKVGRLRMRWLWVLVPLTVIWANLHGMVLLAIVAVGAFAAGETLEYLVLRLRRQARNNDTSSRTRLLRVVMLGLLTISVILAAMTQPSGYHLFFLGRNFTADPLLQEIIAEMKPPPFFLVPLGDGARAFVPGFATFWLSGALFLLALALNKGRLRTGADYLLSFFFLYQAVNHWRLLPLFAIAAAAPAAALLTDLSHRLGRRTQLALQYTALAATLALGAAYVFVIDEHGTFFQRNKRLLAGEAYNHGDYPKPLLDFVIAMNFPGRLLSETNFCGYFMWRLSPEHHKLFTDNRFDLFGSQFHIPERIMFAAMESGDPHEVTGEPLTVGWRDLLDKYDINLIVMNRNRRLHSRLIQDKAWKDVFVYIPSLVPGQRPTPADGWSVWVRDTPAAAAAIQRAEAWWRRNGRGPSPTELDALIAPPPQSGPGVKKPVGTPDWRVPVQP